MEKMKLLKEAGKSAGLICLGLLLAWLIGWASEFGLPGETERYYAYLVVIVGGSITVFPTGELIGAYLEQREPEGYRGPGLERAGKVIGRLERTIILVFYLAGSLEGIAFLVVAKSIYRFGDLRKGYERGGTDEGEEIKFSISEYIILGSLLSYTTAVLGGVLIELVLSLLGLGPMIPL